MIISSVYGQGVYGSLPFGGIAGATSLPPSPPVVIILSRHNGVVGGIILPPGAFPVLKNPRSKKRGRK